MCLCVYIYIMTFHEELTFRASPRAMRTFRACACRRRLLYIYIHDTYIYMYVYIFTILICLYLLICIYTPAKN